MKDNFSNKFSGFKLPQSIPLYNSTIERTFLNSVQSSESISESISRKQEACKKLEDERHEDKIQAINELNKNVVKDIEKFILKQFLDVIMNLEQRVVEIGKRDEVEISNDIFTAVQGIFKYKDITVCREATIGRAKKKLGETDLYLYRENGEEPKEELCIIENKNIEDFTKQYKQLLGYLNHNFAFGITLSINRYKTLEKAMNHIEKELSKITTSYESFKIVDMSKKQEAPYYMTSTHTVPEFPKNEMKIYHLILNLNDSARMEIAKQART